MLGYELYHLALVLAVAMVIDIIVGDPDWLYDKVPHPVVLVGRLLTAIDVRLNMGGNRVRAIAFGGAAIFSVAFALAGLAWLAAWFGGKLVEIIIVASLLAQNSLYRHVKAVSDELKGGDLAASQAALQKLVSRDATKLDKHGVGRSAIESLAENFSDAVMAPVFWFMVAGLPGLVFYKVVNTADSMWGYRSKDYEAFGKVTARLDDVLNFVPARLSVLPVALVAWVLPKADVKRLWAWVLSEPKKHASPNAGYPEAAFAGALNLSLGGVRYYEGVGEKDSWIGHGEKNIGASEIESALGLYRYAIFVLLTGLFGVILW